MARIAATFDQEHADAVVAELSRMNVDRLDWRVQGPAASGDQGGAPIIVPASAAGNGIAGDGGPALAAPFFATGGFDHATASDEERFLHEARDRGATLITVDAPSEVEEVVREIFERHSASNVPDK